MAGKLAARTVPEHALNSLCNEQNLVVQPILQNRLSVLTLDLKEVTAHTHTHAHTHAHTKKSILFIYLKKKKRKQSSFIFFPVPSRTLENCRENKKIARNYTVFVDEKMGKKWEESELSSIVCS